MMSNTTSAALWCMMSVLVIACVLLQSHALHLQMSSTATTTASKQVLIVGGTRFSGLYLWRELHQRGHTVTLFNRGKTALQRLPHETEEQFQQRTSQARFIHGDRKDVQDMKDKLAKHHFDVIYDMNGREVGDSAPLIDMYKTSIEQYIYMSSAGVYKPSPIVPFSEGDAVDENSRHKGKLDTERYLAQSGIPFTSIRPTYIYGPLNYNPLEEYFFSRLSANRKICIPGHGKHVTGLGHVQDLAEAMAQCIGRDHVKGQVYNIQDIQSVSFLGLAKLCAQAMNLSPDSVEFKHYKTKYFDFGEKKAFPLREQHFFCTVDKAARDLDWSPKISLLDGLKDSYNHDFKVKQEKGLIQPDYSIDDMILSDERIGVYTDFGIAEDIIH